MASSDLQVLVAILIPAFAFVYGASKGDRVLLQALADGADSEDAVGGNRQLYSTTAYAASAHITSFAALLGFLASILWVANAVMAWTLTPDWTVLFLLGLLAFAGLSMAWLDYELARSIAVRKRALDAALKPGMAARISPPRLK